MWMALREAFLAALALFVLTFAAVSMISVAERAPLVASEAVVETRMMMGRRHMEQNRLGL